MPSRPTFHEHVEGPKFFENKTAYHYFRLGHGESPDRPFKLFVPLTNDAFGDFINSLHLALQIAGRFEHSVTTFAMFNNRPYKMELLALYPLARKLILTKSHEALDLINLKFFDAPHRQGAPPDVGDYREAPDIIADVRWQDFVLLPNTQQRVFKPEQPLLPLRIPADVAPDLHRRLIQLGLDDRRWFCCMHYREANYQWKYISNIRDCDPDVYLPLIDYVVDRLGGQVVRLGHPEMRDHPPRPGFVDLAKLPDSTMLQAYAVSRARFCVSGSGGANCLMHAFDAPVGLVDSCGWFDCAYQHAFLLTLTVVTPSGQSLRQDALFESGLMNQRALQIAMERHLEIQIVKCTTEEILRVADFMFDHTAATTGWRDAPEMPLQPFDNSFTWPMRGSIRPKFIDL